MSVLSVLVTHKRLARQGLVVFAHASIQLRQQNEGHGNQDGQAVQFDEEKHHHTILLVMD